ncbi:tRNA pseudouridine(38-40) synthase TruA [Candidatus Thorarchaeota archaeon]|nr:MAG: tRNA pseudouridine(38-40) synthase TruA [Candidatus Thorarchaeota archaeon]
MTEHLARLFYLGTRYHGSQYQPTVRTVQGEVIKAVSLWSGEEHSSRTIRFSGRTDRGVHSFGQVVQISTDSSLDLDRINKHLPPDIIFWASVKAPEGFQARYNALLRHYRYYLDDTWNNVDLDEVRSATEHLIGCNDFSPLSKPDGDRNTVTAVLNMKLVKKPGGFYLDVFGTSFLWKFVRKAVTLLYWVGNGKMDSTSIPAILQESEDILPSGIRPAAPEGLVLVETVVPVRFHKSRHAIESMKRFLESQAEFHKRCQITLKGVVSLFSA